MHLFHRHSRQQFEVDERFYGQSGNEYELQDELDYGGNGVVHKCVCVSSGDEFAVKFQLVLWKKRVKRFKRELAFMKAADHAQLMSVLDDGRISATIKKNKKPQTTKLPFIIMPLADCNLACHLEQAGSLKYETYIGQFVGLSEALAEMHKTAVHRDIKPENVLVRGDTWYLADFGLCDYFDDPQKDLTVEGEVVGPRLWMSPESTNAAVGNNDVIDSKSDVFQLASVFWYVVTGRHPAGCIEAQDWTGPPSLFPLFQACLAHNPTTRPTDGADFFIRLQQAIDRALS